MTEHTADDASQSSTGLFAWGWLDDQLDRVVTELASRPQHEQPRLNGSRAAATSSSYWLKLAKS